MTGGNLASEMARILDSETGEFGAAATLFGEQSSRPQLKRLRIDQIDPRGDQPRQQKKSESLDELIASVVRRGILQPIRVRPKGDRFEIIAGERRWAAAQRAGLRHIPAVVVQLDDDDEAYIESLIENIQREDLNAVDRARALQRVRLALGLQSWEEVGQRLGIGRQHVHRLLNVMKLPESIQEDIRVGDLSEKHGRAMLHLNGHPREQAQLWVKIHNDGLSGDAAMSEARHMRPAPPPSEDQGRGPSAHSVMRAARQVLWAIDNATSDQLTAAQEILQILHGRLQELLQDGASAPTDEV